MRYDFTKLTKARMVRGWTQAQLAEAIGEYQSTVSRVEAGKIQHPGTIKKIADVLGLNMEDLIIDDVQHSAA